MPNLWPDQGRFVIQKGYKWGRLDPFSDPSFWASIATRFVSNIRLRPVLFGNHCLQLKLEAIEYDQRKEKIAKSKYQRPKAKDRITNFQRAPNIHEPNGTASDEVSSSNSSDKYQLARNSQLSTFGLTFQICEMYEEGALISPKNH